MTVPLLIDCDPGIDDAVALLLACASPEVRLLGVTTVGGNVALEHTTRNALRLLTLAGRTDVPVAAGAPRPLVRSQPARAAYVHGEDGVRGAELPEPAVPVDPRHAVRAAGGRRCRLRRAGHPGRGRPADQRGAVLRAAPAGWPPGWTGWW